MKTAFRGLKDGFDPVLPSAFKVHTGGGFAAQLGAVGMRSAAQNPTKASFILMVTDRESEMQIGAGSAAIPTCRGEGEAPRIVSCAREHPEGP